MVFDILSLLGILGFIIEISFGKDIPKGNFGLPVVLTLSTILFIFQMVVKLAAIKWNLCRLVINDYLDNIFSSKDINQ